MKAITLSLLCAALCLLLSPRLAAQTVAKGGVAGGPPALAEGAQTASKEAGGVATLYALDPLSDSFCFGDSKDGHVFYNNEVRNRCSDVDFGNYRAGSLSVGIEGGRLGTIVDLGSAVELGKKYGYQETVGNEQGFASLRRAGDKAIVLKGKSGQAAQQLAESALLFGEGRSNASAPVKLGDIYLIRLTDSFDKSFERVVKLKVIAYTPDVSVTVRWLLL
jgi:hypothetical protein